ncbi:30S ribosomal protein S2 [Haladaptatus sp. F3-133]|uniref:Small ribosomal subunit protein uS2 n=1 Tax=Halorutilus salinus TaxID=2487751 RepID=A0A9Q4C292_9EURY|nr:30S ribosomal protein S2 [Halorutilus salinus]MCX2817978.1 30S ribosomal protein S2 [Halorutilus salinus]
MSQEQPEADDETVEEEASAPEEAQETEETAAEEAAEEERQPTESFEGEDDLLIPVDDYLSSGVHIGTQQKTGHMERFIHRVREDGLYVLDVAKTDERIRTAANFLENYEPSSILVTSSRRYGQHPAETFAEATGARVRSGRFIPGTLTNPDYDGYIEPDILVVTDPIGDAQAVKEAVTVGIPVIAMCDTNNATNNVDLVIPTNNKGRKALAVVYGLLAEELLDTRDVETEYTIEDFEPEV